MGEPTEAFDYFRAFVGFPDGTTHRIRSIYFGNAGVPYRITTAPAQQWGPFVEIEGDDLQRVQVSIVGHHFGQSNAKGVT